MSFLQIDLDALRVPAGARHGRDAVETLERVLGAPLDNVGEFLRGRAPRRPAPVLDVGRALHDLIEADR